MSSVTSALWASIVRTLVPLIAGGVLTWIVSLGVDLDAKFEGALTTFLYAVLSAAYYVVARLLETYVQPRLGWLLGLAKAPQAYTARHALNGRQTGV